MTVPFPPKKIEPEKKTRTLKGSRFVPLRYRLIINTSVMLLLLLTVLALILGLLQTRTIRNRIEKQGLVIAENLAAISIDHLITYNYVALEKLANQAANNLDIICIIIHDKEGKVAGYSRRSDLQNKVLTDPVSAAAVKITEPLITVYHVEPGNIPVMEVGIPVFLPGSRDRWGTIRVCISLELMYQQIRQTLWAIGILGCVFLVVGILISNWAAQRVTRPLETLVQATIEASKGNLQQQISIHTRDEVEILADNFSFMIREILVRNRQVESQLSEIIRLQQYTEKILTTMNDGLLVIDMKGNVITMNPAAHAILGVLPDLDAEGCHALELIEKDTQFANHVRTSLENPIGRNQCEILLQKGTEIFTILTGTGVLESKTQTPLQIIFNLTDITALKQLEAGIRQNQRLADLGTMAAGMAHEIRNPLSAIKTYVALLPEKVKKPGFLEKFQTTVPREINRLNSLIEELLELSRPPKYNFKSMDLKELLTQCSELMEAGFKTAGVDFQATIPDDLPKIMADADQLEKVFINLLQNSVQAMPGGGRINLDVSCKNGQVVMDFKDTGHGFSSETAQNIFNPFFTTKAKGTGLGLAISHKVISEHKGRIMVKSLEGEGACFSIILPESRS